ncbi:MAG: LysR family transcriptional regulator [Alphaproteobacteria bacterium]|nr:LysR family transcriptional regulator [Alphaproteobacteria bacterium]
MRHAQLKAFHAVALHGGFSRAAERLGLTQPAVSDHVRKLEEAYGVQLFSRTAKGVGLTAMGRNLFAIAERMFEAETEARDLLSRARTLEEGQLTIGADAAVHILPRLVRFRASYPRIAIRLVTGNSAELLERLEAFAIDVAVTAECPASDAFLSLQLRQDRLVAVMERGAATGGRVTLDRLADMPLILREEGSVTRRLLIEEFRARGLKPANMIEIESREAVREAIAQGLGVAIMSEGELSADPRLKGVAISGWPARMEEWLLCLKSRAGLHVIRSFFEMHEDSGLRPALGTKMPP